MKTLALFVCAFFLSVPIWAQAPNPGTTKMIDETRTTLQKWVETEQLISKEKQEWKLGQQILQDRIDLLQGEIADLETKITESQKAITEADQKREAMTKDNENLKKAADALTTLIGKLEGRVKDQLMPRLPQLLQDKIAPLSQRLPEAGKETKLSLAQRFQNVVGLLNETNKFNSTITTATAVRSIDGGPESEVKEIYLGLGQAFYVTNSGDKAAVGRPGAKGWDWTPVPDRTPEVSRVFRILGDEQPAEFVPLPIKID
jgi:TolA-binding protein